MAFPTAALFPAALAAHRAPPTICPRMPGAAACATLATADPELLKFTADPAGGLSMYAPTRPAVRSVAISSQLGVEPLLRKRLVAGYVLAESSPAKLCADLSARLLIRFRCMLFQQLGHATQFERIAVDDEFPHEVISRNVAVCGGFQCGDGLVQFESLRGQLARALECCQRIGAGVVCRARSVERITDSAERLSLCRQCSALRCRQN